MDVFVQLFEWQNMIILLIGMLIGIIVGALPGLTPTMGVALMIPFTFTLGPTQGLIILGSIFCGSVYGGSIPAILFNVPGAPASVATTFDGYPMTKNGQARKALEISTISSVVGGLFGMLLLFFFAPVFANFSLEFGPAENLWIALFGLTVIAAISDGSVTKNLIGGCIGILLACVGIHTITGTPRFSFGMESFVGGFNIVAVLIGLFAFPQALNILQELKYSKDQANKGYTFQGSSIKSSFKTIFTKPKSLIIGSGLGTFVGMIPGAGGNIASILAYNETKRFSKNKASFGKGDPRGIITSESANNGMIGGALIPLLTLGIPGSPTAAIFLGGLLIHGIWPGRSLFVDHADTANLFMLSMIVAQFALLIIGLLLVKYFVKLSYIPSYIMAPVIVSFSIIGAYTMQNSVFDVYTVVAIGFIMFLLQKAKFSAAPIALGFILGPIAEEGLLQGIQVGQAQGAAWSYFFSGGWNIGLSLLVAITILASIFQAWKQRKPKSERTSIRHVRFLSGPAVIWLGIIFLLAGGFYWMTGLPPQQKWFPICAMGILILLAIIEYGKALIQPDARMSWKWNNRAVYGLIAIVCIVSVALAWIGFYTQVFLLLASVATFTKWKKWIDVSWFRVLSVSVIFTAVMYVVFTVIVKVPLPYAVSLF
ncbi:tripartite tricarboxylate transporter permease [Radiobacillus kanasensis]|uniref:tripartite tricarboxylate transporter permease n=1 Tax=Radiobacillus kanasensis TaxID=2844358 RepID=UPI001E376061|nr:tripartite tricarboxylate transporter permease [Radiobacillus kanasensis]UFU01179.1 tripartite tricarboxylate transporter permease [Radiobacillus kanasensis]